MEGRFFYRTFFIIILQLVNTSHCSTRKLKATFLLNEKNDFCRKEHSRSLLQIRAEGSHDTLHYFWNFIDNPSVLVASTLPDAKLEIEWHDVNLFPDIRTELQQCIPEAIYIPHLILAYGISIQKIYEFNDANDTGNIDSCSSRNINVLNPRYFKWYIKSEKVFDELLELEMVGHSYHDPETNVTRNGNIEMLVSVFGTLDRSSRKPSMLHSENSTQVDLSIENFETNKTFGNSRFAVEVLLVSDGKPDATISIDVTKNINDENTPGVFKVMEIKTPPMINFLDGMNDLSMYMQWRPIAYTTKERDVTDSTNAVHYILHESENISSDISTTILYPYYQNRPSNEFMIVRKLNVSFGANGDGFYKKTAYNSWTFLLGYSNSIDEGMSNMTIAIISSVIGSPLIIMILYGTFTWYRRVSSRSNGSLLLNDDY